MTSKTKTQIKAFFETNDTPTESQFIDLIDSYVDKSGPMGQIETAASAATQGFAFCSAGHGEVINAAAARSFLNVQTTAQVSAFVINSIMATTAQAVAGATTGVLMNPVLVKNAAQAFGGNTFGTQLLHVQDQKSSGTDGGTFTSGAWRTRVLNTVLINEIASASLGSNQISLPAGDYIAICRAEVYSVQSHQIRIRNITDSTTILTGTNEYSTSNGGNASVCGKFTLSGAKVIEIQHQCFSTGLTNGFGSATAFGTEVYAEAMIWKVA